MEMYTSILSLKLRTNSTYKKLNLGAQDSVVQLGLVSTVSAQVSCSLQTLSYFCTRKTPADTQFVRHLLQ